MKLVDIIRFPIGVDDFLRLLAVLLLSFLIIFSFASGVLLGWLKKHTEPKNDLSREPTRMIGGLGTLLIALVANNVWIYGIALFIGGLLIASEQFMINLAAIFNSDRKNVYKIPQQWAEANEPQVKQKQKQEAEEGVLVDEATTVQSTKQTIPSSAAEQAEFKKATSTRLNKIRGVENRALDYLSGLVSNPRIDIKKYIQEMSNGSRGRVYDAIAIDRRTFDVLFGVEIVYRQKIERKPLRISLDRIIERMKSEDFPLVVVLIASDYTGWSREGIAEYKKSLKKDYPGVNFAFYIDRDEELEAINEDDLLDTIKLSK